MKEKRFTKSINMRFEYEKNLFYRNSLQRQLFIPYWNESQWIPHWVLVSFNPGHIEGRTLLIIHLLNLIRFIKYRSQSIYHTLSTLIFFYRIWRAKERDLLIVCIIDSCQSGWVIVLDAVAAPLLLFNIQLLDSEGFVNIVCLRFKHGYVITNR